ncbi:MAG: T9SS type A sorting domain-containing protein [Bacteroidia bacterium]|nr:T9SS type A sorting domain-containing protein [Bacteroidia bacterium]
MNITDNSSFVYSVQYGINDSLSVAQSLVDQRTVNFKVMLIDNTTGETIGVYDDITYNSSNLYQYNSISYQVNTAGIGNRTIRLKLVLNNNFDANYSLSKIYSNESVLAKANHKQIEFDCGGVVKEYALAQNYPNPFNPSTTIRYQIPQDGIVTLKIYDVLGAEVATLVNEQKAAGKYEVNFSATGGASALASGVYIYKIQAGSFASSKKMLLVK